MGLNKREIAVIAETNRGNYAVEIETEDGIWQAAITITNPTMRYPVFTNRGELKTWRKLEDAVFYIRDACPDCQDITLKIGDWKFAKMK